MTAASQRKRLRQPLVSVAAALAAGILLDRWFSQPLVIWMLLSLAAACAWVLAAWQERRERAGPQWGAGFLILWMVCLGGARHHLFWSVMPPDDLRLYAGDEPRLVRLQGTLEDQPEIISPPVKAAHAAWIHHDTSAAILSCRRLVSAGEEVPVSGRAALRVSGHLVHVGVGDEIEVCGWLLRPQPLRNPGGFDATEFLRRQGIACLVTADHPDAVRRLREGPKLSLWRWAARIREQEESLFNRELSPRNAPVATALLFGGRARMDEEIRDAFTQSGTLHVLAISGTHVAILAMLLWGVCRLVGFSTRATALATIIVVVGYAFLTDGKPPVIRATVFVCVFSLIHLLFRRLRLPSGLALAAIGILLWNPSDLFDVGAQLSFLGVLAVLWASQQIAKSRREVRAILDEPLPADSGVATVKAAANSAWSFVREGALISAAAGLFTMPLIAARFHMVSPVSVLANLVLAPLSTVLLWTGYLHAAAGLAAPWATRIFAAPFDRLLTLFLRVVETAAHVRFSHAYVPGPPDWWLVGYYALLIGVAFVRPFCRWGLGRWSLLAAWMILGLAWGLRSPASGVFKCTFLSVGHGEAILLETPTGRTLLYDAGAMQDGRVAERAVQSTLWERRDAGLDAIMLSHADVDHFNGAAGLMETVPVGRLFVSQQFLDFRQKAVVSLCDSCAACGVPIKLLRDGDHLLVDEDVSLRVLRPPPGHPPTSDNANSIVLLIEYAGRRFLLTGDLDGPGQAALLEQEPCHVDVLQSPHHGSRKANPPALADWARPTQVIVSADRRVDFKSLRAAYGEKCEIVSTNDFGAVTFEIRPDGTMSRTTVRDKSERR